MEANTVMMETLIVEMDAALIADKKDSGAAQPTQTRIFQPARRYAFWMECFNQMNNAMMLIEMV